MKFYELEVKGEIYKLRLTSNDCMIIEKTSGKSILDYIQELSVTTIVTLLRYMVRSSIENFSEKDANKLFNDLVDDGYTIKEIVEDVLMEALSVSGFMSKEELEEMKTSKKKK